MSYEGREVWLCRDGHRRDFDCYEAPSTSEPGHCSCGAPWAWWEAVDQTNCEGVESVLVEHNPAVTETCQHCGAVKQLHEPRYCIPSNSGHRFAQVRPTVPIVPVKFRVEGDASRIFDTEAAVYTWLGTRQDEEDEKADV